MTDPDYARQAETVQWDQLPPECCEPVVALGKLQTMRAKALISVRDATPSYRLVATARLQALNEVLEFLEPLLEGLQ